MEKVLEKLKTENGSLKLVADELIKQCEKEPAFIDKILNEKKTLNDCWEYVKSRAKKEAQDGCAVIDNETVYGWAIHYFEEEELEDWKPAKAADGTLSNTGSLVYMTIPISTQSVPGTGFTISYATETFKVSGPTTDYTAQ